MGDQSLGKLTASLEELSLKKQLPLRQQVQKPMLKYSNSAIKPVQLFNHADLVSIRSNADAARNAYSSLSQTSSTNTMSTPFRASVKPSNNSQQVLKQPTTNISTNSGGSAGIPNKASTTRGHSNPYARPLSAKDIVNDIQSQKMKKSPSLNQMGGAANLVPSGSGATMFGFPMNTFMRPQSAFKKETSPSPQPGKSTTDINNKPSSISETSNGYGSGKSDGSIHENKNHSSHLTDNSGAIKKGSVQPPPLTKLEREQDLSEILGPQASMKTGSQSSKTNQFGPGKSTANSGMAADVAKLIISDIKKELPPPAATTKVAAGSQTTNSTLSRLQDASNGNISESAQKIVKQTSGNLPPKSVIYAKPVSSLPRPGSAANSSKSSTPDSQKVRNLNYTPTKPYTEVSNPSPVHGAVTGKPPVPSSIKANETAISVPYENSTPAKQGTTYAAPSTIVKPPSHGSAGNTMYYRKESKADMMIHEQRPAAVGAPAKPIKLPEKGSRTTLTSGSEIDEGDDESEPGLPSGERLPGDGEASITGAEDDDFDDMDLEDDDDMVDDLNDDCIDGSDGESDGYSFTSSSLSRRSSSAHRLKSRPISGASTDLGVSLRPQTASPDRTVKPGLTKSHFNFIPPTVTFVTEGQKVEQLPWEMRKYLKWRLSPITPNVVKHVLARSSFRITKRNHDWLGCWGKHMKSPGFKALREYQKLNHFPGSFQIGRKDRLWRNLSKMQVHFGKKEFGFFPQTYCLPYDAKLCKRAFEDGGPKQKWIIKPPASARGIGIKVINKLTQIPKKRPVIVQKYLAKPYLINDSKFDMRIYVYVSSMDPLRLYVFEDGLARFASMKYSSSMKHLANKFMHLTNYSVNKKNADYQANADETICQGHKWSLKALWNYMKRQGINTTVVWDSVKDLIIKTIICSEAPVNSLVKANCKSRYCAHELFGFDILLDENLKPWILEVNISPSLHSNSQLDVNIKGSMIKDLMNIAGFRIPDKHDVVTNPPQTSGPPDFSNYEPSNNYCMDKRLINAPLSPDERAKHAYYSQRHQDEQLLQTILDILTPDDIRMLTESIDEDSRKGGFQRVFPTPSSHKYLKYFETPRYYNLLLDQWVQRYNKMESRGIALLQSYCDLGIHLELSTERHAHQWNPPNATCHSYREGRLLSAPLSKQKDDHSKNSASCTTLLKTPKRPHNKLSPPQRSISQSSSVSTSPVRNVSNLVFSPLPVDILSPKGKAPSR